MSLLEKQLLSKRLPPRLPGQRVVAHQRDFSPLSWELYFDEKRNVDVDESTFCVYLSGFNDQENKLTLVLLHGGGYSALTWALFTKDIRNLCKCRVIAIDIRGHGDTHTTDDNDLSISTLVNDVGGVIKGVCGDDVGQMILIGHSMGGAIAVHCASSLHELIPNIVGLVVIDVVEGTALDALNSMQSFLRGRPSSFNTIERAIEWCIKSGQTKNVEAARISMPGQLVSKKIEDKNFLLNQQLDILKEEEIDDEVDVNNDEINKSNEEAVHPQVNGFTWRIDLSKTEPYWTGWFTDLSSMFLKCQAGAKLLILAGIDRLDSTLMVGQMQGKFQMQVLPKCGHTVHEDVPDKVAEVIATFITRNKFAEAINEFQPQFPSC